MEWAGLRRVQQSVAPLFERTRRFRVYQPWVIPGLLQSAAYTRAVLNTVAHLRDIPDDITRRTSARSTTHTSPVTSDFKIVDLHWRRHRGAGTRPPCSARVPQPWQVPSHPAL
ncbi:Scr1 family TA system antitoxin-like transcriptional regulator [Streptomyces sp. NPDC002845]